MSLSTINNGDSGSSARSKINTAFAAIDAGWSTGDIKHSMLTTAPTGWVRIHGGTIGKAGSGATERANADTQPLYELLWAIDNDIDFPVSGGRGASAASDFAAGKQLTLPDFRGHVLVAVAGSPFDGLVGSQLGESNHALTTQELPVVADHAHNYDGSGTLGIYSGTDGTAIASGSGTTASTGGFGGNEPHNNVQPTRLVGSTLIKL